MKQPKMVSMTFPETDTSILVPINQFGDPVVSEGGLKNYKQELDLLQRKRPNFAPLVLNAMREGKIIGNNYVDDEDDPGLSGCGCVYGHSTDLNADAAHRLVDENRITLFGHTYTSTYLEDLVIQVEEGDTPHPVYCPQLYVLEQILKLYVPTNEEEGAAVL